MLAAYVSCAKAVCSGSIWIVVTAETCPEDELEEEDEDEVREVEDGLAQ